LGMIFLRVLGSTLVTETQRLATIKPTKNRKTTKKNGK
jgi:hypothetical protein